MTKGDLIKTVLTEEEARNVDTALPHNFVVDCQNLLNIDARKFYVWAYWDDCKAFGKPVNLAELYVERFLGKSPTEVFVQDLNEIFFNDERNHKRG